MQIKIVKSLWGMDQKNFISCMERIAEAGFDGIESSGDPAFRWGPSPPLDFKEIGAALRANNLAFTTGFLATSLDEFERTVKLREDLEPIRYFVHAGFDSMDRDAGCRFFEGMLKIEARLNIKFAVETHRGRLLYSPFDTYFYLRKFPELCINADYSHWVVLCERLPDDLGEMLKLANQRAIHIHARVGFEEGPQVPDPAAPEYKAELDWHLQQWDAIRAAHEQRGASIMTVCPEFGPPPYTPVLPYTKTPVSDLFNVCCWMKDCLRERWNLKEN